MMMMTMMSGVLQPRLETEVELTVECYLNAGSRSDRPHYHAHARWTAQQ